LDSDILEIKEMTLRKISGIGAIGGLIGFAETSDHHIKIITVLFAIITTICIIGLVYTKWVDLKRINAAWKRFGNDSEGMNQWLRENGFEEIDSE